MVVLGQAGVTDGLCRLGVEGAGELRIPVEDAAGVAHLVVDVPGVGDALCDVGSVGGNLRSHDALLDVVHIGQSQMLGGGDIAQEGCAKNERNGESLERTIFMKRCKHTDVKGKCWNRFCVEKFILMIGSI